MRKGRYEGKAGREAEDYITLGRLLSTIRDKADSEAVEEIVSSRLSAKEKIRAIQELDAEAQKDPEKENEIGRRVRPLRYRPGVLKNILRLPHAELPYLAYLFREHRRIIAFGKATFTLDPVFFPPQARVSPSIPRFLSEMLKPPASELGRILGVALEDSWRYLPKIEYNLLVVLKQLCEKITSINFGLFDYRDRTLIDKLAALEVLFLVFHYRPHYQEVVFHAFHEAAGKDLRLSDKLGSTIDLMNRLLSSDRTIPSLYNVLLSLNILKYRRLLSLDDLICRDLGELVNTREFACPPEIRQKLVETVVEARRRLAELYKKRETINRLKVFLSFDESGEVSFAALQDIYEHQSGEARRWSFAEDGANVVAVVSRLFRLFDWSFYPLLNGQVRLADMGSVTLFTHDFFQLDFLRLRRILKKVEKVESTHDFFARSRLVKLQHSAEGITVTEADAMKNIDDGMEIITEMRKKVEAVLAGRQPAGKAADSPVETSILGGKSFSLPHEDHRIVGASVLDGKTIAEALSYFVSLCYSLAVFVQYPPVYSLLEEERQIDRDVRAVVDLLSRLIGPGTDQ